MHEDQLDVDDDLARRLIALRFPELADLPVQHVRTAGTVNTIVRIGDDLVARFPLAAVAESELAAEASALDAFAGVCPFPAPIPIGAAAATDEFPSAWSVQTWVAGETARQDAHADSLTLAEDIGKLIGSLRSLSPGERVFDGRGRGGSLPDHDEWMAECIDRSAHLLDAQCVTALWAALRELPPSGPDTMSHRDLTPPNLLVSDASGAWRLTGVLDGGGFGPADRALDLVAAWHLFDAPARRKVRDGVGAGDIEWFRGAAWALQQAMGLGWYYEETNAEMSALGLSTVRRLLADAEVGALAG